MTEKAAIAEGKRAEAMVMSNYQMTKAQPLWKQLLSSMFSWQGLLVGLISVVMLYNKEITEFVSGLFKSTNAMNGLKKATDDLNEAKKEANISAAKEITDARLLISVIQDETISRNQRLEAAKRLQELYPAIFGNMTTEQMLVSDLTKGYKTLTDAVLARAKMNAIQEKVTANIKDNLDKELELTEKLAKEEKKLKDIRSGRAGRQREMGDGISTSRTLSIEESSVLQQGKIS